MNLVSCIGENILYASVKMGMWKSPQFPWLKLVVCAWEMRRKVLLLVWSEMCSHLNILILVILVGVVEFGWKLERNGDWLKEVCHIVQFGSWMEKAMSVCSAAKQWREREREWKLWLLLQSSLDLAVAEVEEHFVTAQTKLPKGWCRLIIVWNHHPLLSLLYYSSPYACAPPQV